MRPPVASMAAGVPRISSPSLAYEAMKLYLRCVSYHSVSPRDGVSQLAHRSFCSNRQPMTREAVALTPGTKEAAAVSLHPPTNTLAACALTDNEISNQTSRSGSTRRRSWTFSAATPELVAEPATFATIGFGLAGLIAVSRRRVFRGQLTVCATAHIGTPSSNETHSLPRRCVGAGHGRPQGNRPPMTFLPR